jgi:hypothetical protein
MRIPMRPAFLLSWSTAPRMIRHLLLCSSIASIMSPPSFRASVLMQWTRLDDRWQSEKWEAEGVVEDNGGQKGPSVIASDPSSARWLHPGYELKLYRDEAEGYYLNLSAAQPFVFVMWRIEDGTARPKILTLSYNEAARMMDAGEQVDGVPMPERWRAPLAEFVALHYRPEAKKKRARPPSFKGAWRDER